MFKFINEPNSLPIKIFKDISEKAQDLSQDAIDAIAISSYNAETSEVDSRFVNLKYVKSNPIELIFFSNYEGPKNNQFISNPNVSALIYWNKIDVQIRVKGIISKTDPVFSDRHFRNRSHDKNALAISSRQSHEISAYNQVIKNFENIKNDNSIDLSIRPSYWGGYTIKPYIFEFWTGNESRINKRELYFLDDDQNWRRKILQP